MVKFIDSSDIKESFEIGNETEPIHNFFNTINNETFLITSNYKVRKINRRKWKGYYGIGFKDLMNQLKENYFVHIVSSEYDYDDYGFYFENDHKSLIGQKIWPNKFEVIL